MEIVGKFITSHIMRSANLQVWFEQVQYIFLQVLPKDFEPLFPSRPVPSVLYLAYYSAILSALQVGSWHQRSATVR